MIFKWMEHFFTRKTGINFARGLTLIELLIALSIFSVITLSLYLIFSNGIRFSRRFHSIENISRDIRWVVDRIGLDLENIVPYEQKLDYKGLHKVVIGHRTQKNVELDIRLPTGLDKDTAKASLIGTDKYLSFIVPAVTGLKQVSYYPSTPEELKIHQTLVDYFSGEMGPVINQTVREDKKRLFLVREARNFPYLDLEDIKDEIEIEILSANVQKDSLKFSYASQEGETKTGNIIWKDQWGEGYFPLGVQMDIVFITPDDKSQTLKIKKKFLVPLGLPPQFKPKEIVP